MSTIKVGDRVRATCGESILVGTATDINVGGVGVEVLCGGGNCRYWLPAGWTFEVIAPLIPDVVGTIVRDRDGDAWQRRERAWFMAGSETDSYDLDFLQGLGPLEVLWTPEP